MLVKTDFEKEIRFLLFFECNREQSQFNYYLCTHNKFENYGKL